MRNGPPGMSVERWLIFLKEEARRQGEDVSFTPEEIEMIQVDAAHMNAVCTPDEIRQMLEGSS